MSRDRVGSGKPKPIIHSPPSNALIRWRNFRGISYLSGEEHDFTPFFPGGSSLRLLIEILRMPSGQPISFVDACRMVQAEAHKQIDLGNNDPEVLGSSNNITGNWVEWISCKGYQIILDASDFEMIPLDIKVSS